MASDDDIEKLKAQNFEEPIKHDDEVGPVGNLFGSCVQILQALSTKARELDTASRENYHPDGPQRSESANESSSSQSRKEGRVRKMAKSGCVTCRKRKKMCDEGKPECNKCVRDGFICDGYIFTSTSKKPEATNSNPSGQEAETFPKSRQSLPLDGAASQLLVKTLESNVATLLFWDDEFGALSGHLDKALEYSEENRDLTLATLISLADFLSHDLLNATLPLPAYRDDIRQKSNVYARVDKARGIIMDTEAPDREETRNIQDVCEILDSKVARLNVLGPILEESIPSGAAFEQVAAHGQLDDRPAHQYYADQISIRFPNASATLVGVLGKCNWERYMRIHKKREENTQREGSPIGETENMSKFHDSGLGTSVPAQSAFGVPRGSFVYAETEVSKRAEASHRRLPPLPEEGRRGWPFVCDICNSIVRIRRTGAWKKHIFSDVLAYVCIFDDCPSDRCFFEDRNALTAHLGNQHGFGPTWKSAKCPLCLEETGDGMNAISLHFARHMEEVALGAIPRTAESDAGSDKSSTMASSENGRSNSFELDEESREKGLCPVEGCGRVVRDLRAHMLTHIGERPEKCPITTCEYHVKGFARKYDKNRHTLTHYKGTMVCGFCSGSGSAAEKSFNRVDVFKRHLISVHGVEQTIPNSRKKAAYDSTSAAGTCSTCSVTFADAREFYLHLDDCILRVIQQANPAEAINQELLSSILDDEDANQTLDGHILPNETNEYTKNFFDNKDSNSDQHHVLYYYDEEQQIHLKPFKCPVIGCPKAYKNENGLKYHKQHGHRTQKLTENADGTYSIVDPEISVPYPSTVDAEKERPYRCETCGYTFSILNSLKQHRAVSTLCSSELKLNAMSLQSAANFQGMNAKVSPQDDRGDSTHITSSQSYPRLARILNQSNDRGTALHIATKQALMDQLHDNLEVPSNDTGRIPKIDRNMTDMYADQLFDPNSMARAVEQSTQSAHSSNAPMPSPARNVLTDRLQAAHQARSKSPEYSSRRMNPFIEGSPLAPPSAASDTFPSWRMEGSIGMGSLQLQTILHSEEGESSMGPLLPDSGPSGPDDAQMLSAVASRRFTDQSGTDVARRDTK